MKWNLLGNVVPRTLVDDRRKDRLFYLWKTGYPEVDRDVFETNFRDADWVLLLSNMKGLILGYTTLRYYNLRIDGRRIRAIFNGSTVLEPKYQDDGEMVRTWCRFMARLKREELEIPLYWYQVVGGYRAYLFLSRLYESFYPNHVKKTPEFEARLLEILGRHRYPGEYEDGIINLEIKRDQPDRESAVPRGKDSDNLHVRYFVERNPGYLRGNELACLAEFSLENMKGIAFRIAKDVLEETTVIRNVTQPV